MRITLLILLLLALGCKTNNTTTQPMENKNEFTPQFVPGPPALVYKTSEDYNNLVPVILSDDKTEIVSYPAPTDVTTGNGYQTPTVLNGGYLLDNRGIGKNVAFLKLTYEEYSKLPYPPEPKELYELIIDTDPLTELCNCGNKSAFRDITKQLNEMIETNTLKTKCKQIVPILKSK